MTAFSHFGDRASFALEVELRSGRDTAAPAASVGSWGAWRLWVAGRNLCEQDRGANGPERDAVVWYLAPFFRWLTANWAPLLHEQRLPAPDAKFASARDAYLRAVALWLGDSSEAFATWQLWARRHALRTASEGAVLPDVFMRRLGDGIEVSWGDRAVPGGEHVAFRVEPGVAEVAVVDVAKALGDAIDWFLRQPSLTAQPWFAAFGEAAAARDEPLGSLESWFLDAAPAPGPVTRRLRDACTAAGVQPVFSPRREHRALTRLDPAVAMFGAVSPTISDAAAARLLALLRAAEDSANAPRELDAHVEDRPATGEVRPWDDGYNLALLFGDDTRGVDVEMLVSDLEITVTDVGLDSDGPRGAALAGDRLKPIIAINVDHASNQGRAGRRFTIAHELCHLLYDRGRARRVTHTSTPWAPRAVEQRANAFAAMLLMPPDRLRAALPHAGAETTLDDIVSAARQLGVGVLALLRHLENLNWLSPGHRRRLAEAYRQPRPATPPRKPS